MKKYILASLLLSFTAVAEENQSKRNKLEVKQQMQEEIKEDFYMPHQDLDPENWQSIYEKMEQEEEKQNSK